VIFTWDIQKAAANLKKHGVDFRETATAFGDLLSLTFPDEVHSQMEERFLTIGIFSSRLATRREQRFYEKNQP
jgi:hypothetical protein